MTAAIVQALILVCREFAKKNFPIQTADAVTGLFAMGMNFVTRT
jgi:hypothetical protein